MSDLYFFFESFFAKNNYYFTKMKLNQLKVVDDIIMDDFPKINQKPSKKSTSHGELVELFLSGDIITRRHTALWKGVIMQALVDLASRSKKKMAKINRIKSIMWINLNSEDFKTACAYAELDPKYVHKKAKEIQKDNPMIDWD